jgi:hypothetical protein
VSAILLGKTTTKWMECKESRYRQSYIVKYVLWGIYCIKTVFAKWMREHKSQDDD